jgi:zinc/manganese transport system substrate-binding protein
MVVAVQVGPAPADPLSEASRYDPHWWHDPRNVESATIAIRDALVAAEPAHKDALTRSALAYATKLKTLDAGIQACFDAVPADQRKLVISHDTFTTSPSATGSPSWAR